MTGTLLGDATNGYYVNMPKSNKNDTPWPTIDLQTLIDNGVTRLTVYDDGGKYGNYDTQCNGRLILHAPSGYKLRFSGTITSENGSHSDDLTVYNGTTTSGTFVFPSLWSTINGEPTPFGPYISSGNEALVTFYSYSSPAYAGFEMTADLVDATQTFAITKATATGGSIETTVGGSPVTQNTMDQTVTVTASPESGYWLSDISVGIDGSTVTVPALGGDFISNAATFTMPAAAVTVTPTFTDNPADLCVKMPASGSWTRQIPTGITSFKVYDDGGATGNYSKNCNGSLTLTAPENCVLMLTGSIATDMGDNFYVFNGTSVLTYKDAINTVRRSTTDGEAIDIGTLISTGRSLTLQFKSGSFTNAGLDLTATVIDATHAYAISIDPNLANGSIAPTVGGSAANSATVNQTVTLTVTPANSFTVTEVSYTVGGTKHVIEPDNGTYSFTMSPADVTVSAVFMDEVMTHWGVGNDGSEQHPDVALLADANDCTPEEMRQRLKAHYDGYMFTRKSPEIYNPFSLFRAFETGEIGNYWFESGTPTFLVRQMQKYRTDITALDSIEADVDAFDRPTESLEGRTLYKDGKWNTLCLPFDVTVGSGVMAGATTMTLNGSTSGFNASTGVLTLNFDGVASGITFTDKNPSILFLGAGNTLYYPESGAKIGAQRA